MSASILIIEYRASDAQQALPSEQWHERARQIGSLAGLRWKYWLTDAASDRRGGVYLFEGTGDAGQAAAQLTEGLRQAGARDVTSRIYAVDGELSSITRGTI